MTIEIARKPQPGFWMAVAMSAAVVWLQQMLVMPAAVWDMVLQHRGVQTGFVYSTHPLVMSVVNTIAFGGVIFWGLWLNRPQWHRILRFGTIRLFSLVALLLCVLGMAILVSEVDNLFRRLVPVPGFLLEFFTGIHESPLWMSILLLVIVAPVTEELLFRGVILRGLAMRVGSGVAVLVSALLFALVHLNPWQFLTAFPLGLLLGWWYLRTGSLTPCILGHALLNGLFVVVSRVDLGVPGMIPPDDMTSTSLQPWWLDLAGLMMLGAGIGLFLAFTPRRAQIRVHSIDSVESLPPRLDERPSGEPDNPSTPPKI